METDAGRPRGASRLILNARVVDLADEDVNLLDWLRASGLTAAKPGCRGGDCGACQVLVGEIPPEGAEPSYRSVNSCLLTTSLVADCHVITVEGLDRDPISPVQRALVDEGAIGPDAGVPGFPMGLPIGSHTPQEIAVSVAAELVLLTSG